ncbi:MAG: TIGR01906 family membrane protein [Anaerolineales bacterium]|jgi:integral membrane protein (TIGR01906 family)
MKILCKILSWGVTILLPLALTFLGVRLLLTHAFPEIEYRLPGFPADEYGFTLQDRLHWSKISIDYLLNIADISFLGDLTFPDGSPLFNPRELSHMHDVKGVVQPALGVGYGVWFLILALGLWARFGGWWWEFERGIQRGGWVTVGLVAVLGILAGISFWQFFTVFHELFFTGNSWIFLYSDTLIRLFPMQFWQDAFLFVGALDVVFGLVLGLTLPLKRK